MKNVKFLRISYWLGAIADFVYGIVILFPSRAGVDTFVYPTGLFASVAISWGIMLVMADRSPYERRWVLIPTIIVVILLGLVNLFSHLGGVIDINTSLLRLSLSGIISSFMIYSYIKTN